ncbi:MAG: hypothetical protein ABIE07_00700 [Candidatus Zixiibacteriota bacterium]
MRYKRVSIFLAVIIIAISFFSGCKEEVPLNSTEAILFQKCEELFTRIKVGDFDAAYENEFPYLREEASLEEYLKHPRYKNYSIDTLVALQLDSIRDMTDSAFLYIQLEWLLADSSLFIQPIGLRYYYSGDEWIKPSLSRIDDQRQFEEELRVYWDAVGEIQEKEALENKDSL